MPADAPAPAALLAGAVAGVVGLAASAGRGPLVAAVVAVQIALVIGWLGSRGAAPAGIAIAAAAAVAADVYAGRAGELDRVAGVVAAGFIASLVAQLARRNRTKVTESLARGLSGVVLVVLTAYLLAVQVSPGGRAAAALVGFAVGAALLTARLVDSVARRPRVGALTTRGWPALAAAAVVATGLGVLFGGWDAPLTPQTGALIALASAIAALAADLAVATIPDDPVDPADPVAARPTVAVLLMSAVLPLTAAAPVGYAVTSLAVS